MAIFRCKMCGGDLELDGSQTVGICDSCGTQQTLPRLEDDKRINLYDRASHFRRNNEFDKAMGIYEKILEEDSADAEAYWSLVLCRYGIEYVEDPATKKRIPTVNRAQFTSVFDDDNYKSALSYADAAQKAIYEAEAKAINEIQKGILAISQKEEPFDVFICYKETDNGGRRTPDSVLANDLYHQLTQEGFKVFFARITLEDKLGSAYEPYIFAALNSAKVMVVLGTRPEYFNAVWVKNEWARYLSLIKQGQKKILIPAYKDMDPYDLPEEFSHLQAQDMSKLGFMQDLIRGIKKLAQPENAKPAAVKETVVAGSSVNIAPLLKRAFMFLEDRDWSSANEYCEKVLDQDPENAQAYVGKLMAELRVPNQASLKGCAKPFDGSGNYQKAMRFGDSALKTALSGYIKHINDRNENARLERLYNQAATADANAKTETDYYKAAQMFDAIASFKDAAERAKKCREEAVEAAYCAACEAMCGAATETAYKAASDSFRRLKDYKDSDAKRQECLELAETARKDQLYLKALNAQKAARSEENFKAASRQFAAIADHRDSAELAQKCLEQAEAARKDTIYYAAVGLAHKPGVQIRDIELAIEQLQQIIDWRDAKAQVEACHQAIEARKEAIAARELREKELRRIQKRRRIRSRIITTVILLLIAAATAFAVIYLTVTVPNGKYDDAIVLMNDGKFEEAIEIFQALDGHKDSEKKIEECRTGILDVQYDAAIALMEQGQFEEAILAFTALEDHRDSPAKIGECEYGILDAQYNEALNLMDSGKFDDAAAIFSSIPDHRDSPTKVQECTYGKAAAFRDSGSYWEAIALFTSLENYQDSQAQIEQCYKLVYDAATALAEAGKNPQAAVEFGKLGDYEDARQRSLELWAKAGVRQTVSAGDRYTVALRTNGSVVATGENGSGQCDVSGWTDIVSVSAGDNHTVGLKSDGTVVAVGYPAQGQCSVSDWTDIVSVSAGTDCTVGLKVDGTVVSTCGTSFLGKELAKWTDIIAISAGYEHVVGIKADGTVVAAGTDRFGQCKVSQWTDIVAVSAGNYHTIGLKADGTVVAAGYSSDGRCDVTQWTDIVAISTYKEYTVGLKADGTVVATEYNGDYVYYGQCDVGNWKNIVAISVGELHTVALKSNGTVVAIGDNSEGQRNVSYWQRIQIPEDE